MSSTYSSNLRVELIGSGDQAGTWGTTTDNNFAYVFDTAIAGAITVTIAGTPQALTAIQGPTSTAASNQAVFATLKLVSAPAAFTLYAPPAAKQYIVWNATSYTATIGNATALGGTTSTGGTTITLAAGEKAQIWSDNTNFYKVDTNLAFVTGTLAVANGGTGATSFTSGALLKGAGTGAVAVASAADIVGQISSTPVTNATNQSGGTVNATTGTFSSTVTGPNYCDAIGTNNVNLGSGGTEGRGVVAGYSGGSYGGIGTNVRHTGTGATYIAPTTDTSSYLLFQSGGFTFLGAGTGSAGRTLSYSTLATLDVSGNFTATANVTAYSDERFKTNWRNLPADFIEQLAQVKHGIYDRTDQELTQVGVSAQSLQPVMPNAVIEDDGKLSVAYGNAALVAAIKLAERVVALEAKIAELTKE